MRRAVTAAMVAAIWVALAAAAGHAADELAGPPGQGAWQHWKFVQHPINGSFIAIDVNRPESWPEFTVKIKLDAAALRFGLPRLHGEGLGSRADAWALVAVPASPNHITGLGLEHGALWLGSDGGGLWKLDSARRRWHSFAGKLPSGRGSMFVRDVLPAGDFLWVKTAGLGLCRYAMPGAVPAKPVRPLDRIRIRVPHAVHKDGLWKNVMFVNMRTGVWTTITFSKDKAPRSETLRDPATQRASRLTKLLRIGLESWIGTDGAGLFRYSARTGRVDRFNCAPIRDVVHAHKRLYLVTWVTARHKAGVLTFFDLGTAALKEISLPEPAALSVIACQGPWAWVGTNMGLFVLDSRTNTWHKPDLNFGKVNCIACDSKQVWVGTDRGVFGWPAPENKEVKE